jgi:transposase InsO family protein
MPWRTEDLMTLRAEFVMQANTGKHSHKELCDRFDICRATGYKWLGRFNKQRTLESLRDLSREPKNIVNKIPRDVESVCVALRRQYPSWGAKKLKVLFRERVPHLKTPSERTFNRIIARNGLLSECSPKGTAFKRFEYPLPNDLWQMDYKGEFLIKPRQYCYPLTVLDDHSRFNLVLDAHDSTKGDNVRQSLTKVFRRHGMPSRMAMDRGSPWHSWHDAHRHLTSLSFWLVELDIQVIFSRPYHPQTLGKEERFHRTLKYDLLEKSYFGSFEETQESFDLFRHEYNYVRPHEAIGLKRPGERYTSSPRIYPETIKAPEYPLGSIILKVHSMGSIHYRGHKLHVHRVLAGKLVRLVDNDNGLIEIYYRNTLIKQHNT